MATYTVKRIVLESYFVLLIAAVFSLLAGFLLQENLERILRLTMLVALVPPINDMGGNIGCIVGARLATALHLGTIGPGRGRKHLRRNIWGSMISGVLSFGVTAAVLVLFKPLGFPGWVAPVFFLAGIFQTAIAVFVSVWLAFIAFREGLDPDNVVAPIITSVCDVGGVAALLLAVKLVGV
jgi:mgtE-like transporter